MNAKTVKLHGRDLLWYELRENPVAAKKTAAWRRHLMVVISLLLLKLVAIASSDGVELLIPWIADSQGLLGCP